MLSFTYSEFYGGLAKETFNREFKLDLDDGSVFGYKGAIVEVIEATNMAIRYKVIRNFED